MGNRNTFQRQQSILDLLFRHEEGLRRAQLATLLHVDKSTVTRDCQRLLEGDFIRELPNKTIQLVHERYKFDVRLSVDEMQALTLACRSLAVNLRWNLPYAAQALRKLASSHESAFPILSSQILETARLMEDETQTPQLANLVSQLSQAIEKQKLVVIRYFSQSSQSVQTYRVLPGRLEPYASGHSLYLYALNPEAASLRVLKVDRMKSLSLTTTKGSVAEIELLRNLLNPERFKHSWGIWVSDKPPQKVILRFSKQVVERVKETRWHPTQQIEDYVDSEGQRDGTILWSAWISETKEMIPWIRGWGEDCLIVES